MKSKLYNFIIFLIALFNLIHFINIAFKEKKYNDIVDSKVRKYIYIFGLILGMACSVLVMYIEISFLVK